MLTGAILETATMITISRKLAARNQNIRQVANCERFLPMVLLDLTSGLRPTGKNGIDSG